MYNITQKIDSGKGISEISFNGKAVYSARYPEDKVALDAKIHELKEYCGINEIPIEMFTLFANLNAGREPIDEPIDTGPQAAPAKKVRVAKTK